MCKKIAFTLFISLTLFLACQSKVEQKPVPLPTMPIKAQPAWQVEWEKTLAEAKKEGRLIIYTSYEPSVNKYIKEAFAEKFGIEIEYVVGTGPLIIPKLVAERKAGIYLSDVFLGGTDPILFMLKPSGAMIPLKESLFLPEVLDQELWYKGTLPWVDDEKRWIVQTKGGAEPGELVINTNLVGKGELISYYDLLKPKYKGKINMYDPTLPGRGNKWFGTVLVLKSLDLDFMKALVKQELLITRDIRLQVEWVAHGKHLVSMLPRSAIYREFLEAGAPLDYIKLKESKLVLGGGTSGVALIEKASHPNAAKLFVNWFLSKEGQTAFSKAYMYQSFRLDVPTDHLDTQTVRDPKLDYHVETEDFLKKVGEMTRLAKEIFGPLQR